MDGFVVFYFTSLRPKSGAPKNKCVQMSKTKFDAWVSEDQDDPEDSGMYEQYHPDTLQPCIPKCVVYKTGPRKLHDLETKKLIFGKPGKKSPFGGYKVPALYNGNPLIVQTPPMECTFGLNVYKNGQNDSKVLELSFYQKDRISNIDNFFNTMRMLDFYLLSSVVKNRASWLKQVKPSRLSDDQLWTLYKGITRRRESAEGHLYSPRFGVKAWDKSTVLYGLDHSEEQKSILDITPETIPPHTWLVVAAEFTGLWITRDGIYPVWRVNQMQIVPPPEEVDGLPPHKKPRLLCL